MSRFGSSVRQVGELTMCAVKLMLLENVASCDMLFSKNDLSFGLSAGSRL